jgi:hypothetical protein
MSIIFFQDALLGNIDKQQTTGAMEVKSDTGMDRNISTNYVKGKGKAFPLQAWTGPWGSRMLRVQNF